eukprot:3887653-Prymnesium_polylepis.1
MLSGVALPVPESSDKGAGRGESGLFRAVGRVAEGVFRPSGRRGGADYLRTRPWRRRPQSRAESHWGPTNLQRGHAVPL